MVLHLNYRYIVLIFGVTFLVMLFGIACGSASEPTDQASSDTSSKESAKAATPIPVVKETSAPTQSEVAQDSITIVMAAEPGSIDPWNPTCNATLDTAACNEIVTQPLT